MLTSYQPLPLHPSISVGQVGQEFTSYFLPMTSTDVPDDLSHRPITMGVLPASMPFSSKTHRYHIIYPIAVQNPYAFVVSMHLSIDIVDGFIHIHYCTC